MTGDRPLIEEFITRQVAPGARTVAMQEHPGGAQGYSGVTLRYYDVTYERMGATGQVAVITKQAQLVERRTLTWLGERKLPVPRSYTRDLTTEAAAPVAMEDAGTPPPSDTRAKSAAQALAAIHHAALGRADELSWLPRADPTFFADIIVERCWRSSWRNALTGAGYTDWYGRWRESRPGGDPFWAQFAGYDATLEAAAAQFIDDMAALWAEGDALTLIHADFHGENVRSRDGHTAIIDWEQARYGPLYIDLPNYFTREEALLYRDALAERGHGIPSDRFLARYDAASRYVGFKYFGFGVLHWREGNPPRRRDDALYWIDMALHGASGGRPARATSRSQPDQAP